MPEGPHGETPPHIGARLIAALLAAIVFGIGVFAARAYPGDPTFENVCWTLVAIGTILTLIGRWKRHAKRS